MAKLNTADFEILVGLEIAHKELLFEYSPKERIIAPEIRRAINKAWARKLSRLEGMSTGITDVFPLYRYDSHEVKDHAVIIFTSATDYKETYGTNVMNPHFAQRFGIDSLGNALAVCGAVLGTDNSILLLRRSEIVHDQPGWWHIVGGHLERNKWQVLSNPDPARFLRGEIEEELPSVKMRIQSLTPICFIRHLASSIPELCYLAKTDLPLHTGLKLELNFEHNSYAVLPCTLPAIATFLEENWNRVVASTKAALFHLCLLRFNREAVRKVWNCLGEKSTTRE